MQENIKIVINIIWRFAYLNLINFEKHQQGRRSCKNISKDITQY